MASNLPPGVTESMLPGNRPEDVLFDRAYGDLCEGLDKAGIDTDQLSDDQVEKLAEWLKNYMEAHCATR